MSRNNGGVPHDPEAERAVIGAMFVMPYGIEEMSGLLGSDDFYSPLHGAIFTALVDMFNDGTHIDARSVVARLAGTQYEPDIPVMLQLAEDAPVLSHTPTHATRVIEMASRRRLLAAAAEITVNARDLSVPWADVAGVSTERVAYAAAEIDPVGKTLDIREFVERHNIEPVWVVPGMIERGDKILLVGREGGGKSVLLRQWAVMIAAGIHPRNRAPMQPRRVLIVDLENGSRLIAKWLDRVWAVAREAMPDADPDALRIVARPDGIDLTARGDRRWLMSRVADARPDIIVLGPLYKLHRGEEERSEHTGAIARELDTLRVRFGCALLMETHAPHESFKEGNILRPAGSRVWLRWPDFVLGFRAQRAAEPGGAHLLDDRVKARDVRHWPRRLVRTDRWPWDTIDAPQPGGDL